MALRLKLSTGPLMKTRSALDSPKRPSYAVGVLLEVTENKPATLDELIARVQQEFPAAGIRVTGHAPTIHRQAEVMARRIRANRREFLQVYPRQPHITEMEQWVTKYPDATASQTVAEFERIIKRAISRNASGSGQMSEMARDISWPHGTDDVLNQIEARIVALGATVWRELHSARGRLWRIDW